MASRSISALRFASPTLRSLSRPVARTRQAPTYSPKLSRPASTEAADARSVTTRLKNLAFGTSISLFLGFAYLYATDTRAGVHQWLVVPSLRWIYADAEEAHEKGTEIMKTLYSAGLHIRERGDVDAKGDLSVTVFGQKLDNPIGTSAGIDKHAEIPDALLALGGAIVEVGGATPLAQEGNPKPRVFRLPEQRALINRYGLNSKGAEDMAMRLRERVRLFAYHAGIGLGEEAERIVLDGEAGVPPGSLTPGKLMLVQIAKNKNTPEEDAAKDYVSCTRSLAKYADVLVVNVSSPNTPGLRTLQNVEPLTKLLTAVVSEAQKTARKTKPRVMVKVSPDEDEDAQIQGIVEAVWRGGVDGVIVGNTTKRRNGLVPEGQNLSWKEKQLLEEQGGFSGPPLFQRTVRLVKRYRTLLDQGPPPQAESQSDESSKPVGGVPSGDEPASTITEKIESVADTVKSSFSSSSPPSERKVIFATGGISNGKQALEVLQNGADVCQVYTALVYGGAGTISRIKREMREEISKGAKR